MRCVYTGYTELYEKHGTKILRFSDLLKAEADLFFRREVCGHSISDIAYLPNEVLIDDMGNNRRR